MLHKDHISKIQIYSEEWHQFRKGKFTSSRINCLMTDKEFAEGAMTYIYHKVGETITGHTTSEDDQIEDENTVWGIKYEPEAIAKFGNKLGIKFLATQKMITNPEGQFSSTPDAIWIRGISQNEYEYNVRTVEVKCPRKYHKFIPFYMAKTPADIKKLSKVYYWQVVDQMHNCFSSVGYFVVYHPLFPEGSNMNIIEFKKMDLWEDFKLLEQRKKSAVAKFNEIRSGLLQVTQVVTTNSESLPTV
jgi:hypothetical protein